MDLVLLLLFGVVLMAGSLLGYWIGKRRGFRPMFKGPPIPLILSAIGLIFAVCSIIMNDWLAVIMGAFTAVCFFPDVLLVKHIKIRILHRLSIFAVVVLGYYVSPHLWGIILLIAGAVALVDAIHLIIRRDTIHLIRRKSLGE